MTFQPTQDALYFDGDHIQQARQQRDHHVDLQIAWQWLLASTGDLILERKPKDADDDLIQVFKPALSPAGDIIQAAFRYRFADDAQAGQQAYEALRGDFGLHEQPTFYETISHVLTAAHVHEMLRSSFDLSPWLATFYEYSAHLLAQADTLNDDDRIWLMPLIVIRGVLIQDESQFQAGVQQFQSMIDSDIHPEGFIKSSVQEIKVSETAFLRMVRACAAMTLTAEAATRAGHNLWAYENRDVGLNTAITYLVYYYFYPDKWRWGDDDLHPEQTERIFMQEGAWIEIATSRVNPRGVELLLDDQRPLFNAHMGGLTTLSHIKTRQPKKRGWFR